MSRLPRYRRGSLVHHLIAFVFLLAGGLAGVGADDRAVASEVRAPKRGVIETVSPVSESTDVPNAVASVADSTAHVAKLAGLDTALPGVRTYLAPNYPNPFQAKTTIEFSLASEMPVTLTVYDFWYNVVEVLVNNETLSGGTVHSYVFSVFPRKTMVIFSGMYFYTLRAGGEIQQRRMLLMK